MCKLNYYLDLLSKELITFEFIPEELQEEAHKILDSMDYSGDDKELTEIEETEEISKASNNIWKTINGKIVTRDYLPITQYARPGTRLKKITKIAIHYAGGAGCTAAGIRSWFGTVAKGYRNSSGSYTYASSHYTIGLKGEIIQMIPENEYSYCTNSANAYSISIENCHPTSDGHFNSETYSSLVELCVDLCYRYKLNPLTDLIRHYDVTGKKCPLYWVNHPSDWVSFKNDVNNKLKAYRNNLELKKIKEEQEMLTTKTIGIENSDKDFVVNEINGKNYFPSEVLVALGINVSFNPETKKVTLNKDTKDINIEIDGEKKTIQGINIKGSNYVPLRTMELLGAAVDYNAETKTPIIKTK